MQKIIGLGNLWGHPGGGWTPCPAMLTLRGGRFLSDAHPQVPIAEELGYRWLRVLLVLAGEGSPTGPP